MVEHRATPAPLPVAAPVQRDPEELARAAALQRMSAGVATFAAQLDSAVAQIKAVALGRSTSSGTNADHDSTATFLFSCGCRKFRVGKAFCQTFSSVRVQPLAHPNCPALHPPAHTHRSLYRSLTWM
jgi:hypothetical protein